MSAPDLTNLPSKFHPFLLGHEKCPAQIKENIDSAFEGPLERLKSDYIFDAGDWVLKLGRTDGILTTPDTHIYRIRKAEKIRTFIQKHGLEDHIEVPKKYLYWHNVQRQFYVVAEKMKLSDEVAKPAAIYKKSFKQFNQGQAGACANGARQRSLTPIQAESLARLSILGYTDLTYNNMFFTQDGKVAIVDTEPVKRGAKKRNLSNWTAFLLGGREACIAQQALVGIAKLKVSINDPTALKAVEKVERNHALWTMAKIVTKIAICTLAIYFSPAITSLIPIAPVAKTLKISLTVLACTKNLAFALQLISVKNFWGWSCQKGAGLAQIGGMEAQGVI